MQEPLFQLLRYGLHTSSPNVNDTSVLSRLSESEWEALFEIAKSQGVAGIAFDGIRHIIDVFGKDYLNHFNSLSFWRRFITSWAIGIVEQGYENGNVRQLSVIADVQERWAQKGIRMMLLKGMAMGTYYPVPTHRAPGDIDCYLFGDYAKGNELARDWADKVDERWYKHSQIFYRREMIENHRFFVHTREGKQSKELECLMVNALQRVEFEKLPSTGALLPPPMFNALFLTYHALTHFLEEGLRLKQLVDWAMFLNRDADKVDWLEFYRICDKYHMRRFAALATDVAVNYLGVELDNPLIETSSPYTHRVLDSTFNDNDYVFSSGESGWKNRWHIVRNLWKYRWKYHMIYRHSILRQLWLFATGYLFKTEYV